MTSLLCVKSPSGAVLVHDKAHADLMLAGQDGQDGPCSFMPRSSSRRGSKRLTGKRPASTPAMGTEFTHTSMDAANLINNTIKMQDWISNKQIRELQEKSVVESKGIRQLYNPLLQTEETFVKDVTDYLQHADLLDLRKKEILHKTWDEKVYQPIRRQILSAVNGNDSSEKDRRRRELHRQYLEHVNKKGHVFLDTMDKGEYYAQALYGDRPAPITVFTEGLKDPLLAQGRKRSEEDATVLRCTTGEIYSPADMAAVKLPPLPLVPLGRHGTDSLMWLEMPLGNIESTPRKASRLRMKGNCTQTQIDFATWSKLTHDPDRALREMKLQRKRMFEEKPPYGRPARQFAKAAFATETTGAEIGAGAGLCPVNT